MPVYYRLDELNDNLNSDETKKSGLYPRVVNKGTVFLDDLINRATKGTTINAFEAKAAMQLVIRQIAEELKNGMNVCIDDFGMFYLTARSRKGKFVQDGKEIRSASIGVGKLAFRMSKAFVRKLGTVEFVRLPPGKAPKKTGP